MGKQAKLKQNAQKKFSLMVRSVTWPSARKLTKSVSSDRTNAMSAASTATCAPTPMAMPTFACARAGESFIPSPTNATMELPRPPPLRFSCSCCTQAFLVDGKASAMIFLMPTSLAMDCAVAVLSPVHIHTSAPIFSCSQLTTHWASSRKASFIATAPTANPSTCNRTTVCESPCILSSQACNGPSPPGAEVSSKKRTFPTRAVTPPS
mmetsp:Transcript_42578/g.97651  ORF Transcript_42578/g.97651 Transcript_42578/m.97651 type:complete len:208 (-) Transcript_42578:2379-3002(-)